jgi:hypothetical protein
MLVWVDGWQMQCCGDPFEVGSQVSWTILAEVDVKWLTSVLGPDRAATVDCAEESHGAVEQLPVLEGTVRSIELVYCQYASDGRVQLPVPGSAVVTQTQAAIGWEESRKGMSFVGYLVDIAVSEPA